MSAKYTYRGESRQKKSARDFAYNHIPDRELWNPEKRHIVLAGFCGDIDYLTALSVQPKNIIACDLDMDCVQSAKDRGVTVPTGYTGYDLLMTVKEAIKMHGKNLSSINADFCRTLPMCIDTLEGIAQACVNARISPHILLTTCNRKDGLKKNDNEEGVGAEREIYLRTALQGLIDPTTLEHRSYYSGTFERRGSSMCIWYMRPCKAKAKFLDRVKQPLLMAA